MWYMSICFSFVRIFLNSHFELKIMDTIADYRQVRFEEYASTALLEKEKKCFWK